MAFNSAIYTGKLQHRRTSPKVHDFTYDVSYFYLDLSEIDKIFSVPLFFSHKSPRLFGFDRSRYLGKTGPLDEAVRKLIFEKTGKTSTGPIRMLTHITYFGFCFNPVSFYYCFNENDTELEFIAAEITNTPWNERKTYAFECIAGQESFTFDFTKDFHVSPFFPMNLEYTWKFSKPTPQQEKSHLKVFMEDFSENRKTRVFFANLVLNAAPLNGINVFKNILNYPLMTFKTVFAIYFQALKLYLKRIPFYTHPDKIIKNTGEVK